MKTEIYWIPAAGPGKLAVMPRPRGGDWLEEEIWSLRQAGVDILVSMLQRDEEASLGLEREGELARAQGMEFISHPIPDRDVPESPKETWKLARSLPTTSARASGSPSIAAWGSAALPCCSRASWSRAARRRR